MYAGLLASLFRQHLCECASHVEWFILKFSWGSHSYVPRVLCSQGSIFPKFIWQIMGTWQRFSPALDSIIMTLDIVGSHKRGFSVPQHCCLILNIIGLHLNGWSHVITKGHSLMIPLVKTSQGSPKVIALWFIWWRRPWNHQSSLLNCSLGEN